MNTQRPTTPDEALARYADEHSGDLATVGPPMARNLDPDDFAQSLWQHAIELTRAYAECVTPKGGAR
jgi:hypothetical protein